MISSPRFRKGQRVRFIGGVGQVQIAQPDSTGGWIYWVEMERESDPGGLRSPTTIVLQEADIQGEGLPTASDPQKTEEQSSIAMAAMGNRATS
jgi:hypothetical protein